MTTSKILDQPPEVRHKMDGCKHWPKLSNLVLDLNKTVLSFGLQICQSGRKSWPNPPAEICLVYCHQYFLSFVPSPSISQFFHSWFFNFVKGVSSSNFITATKPFLINPVYFPFPFFPLGNRQFSQVEGMSCSVFSDHHQTNFNFWNVSRAFKS